jgi:CBS domain-containing protein
MTVADIMTHDVTAVSPETAIHDAARLLIEQEVPALPVVDSAFRVIGMLSEQDLMVRLGPRRRRPWWQFVIDTDRVAREYRQAVGLTAGEVMTHPVTTVIPETSLESVIALFDDQGTGVVAVVSEERLVGTIDRRDLVKALLTVPVAQARRSDADLIAQMRERMAQEAWISRPRPAVHADHGVLALWGFVSGDAEKAALVTMARSIPGCRDVEDRLISKGTIHRYHEMI